MAVLECTFPELDAAGEALGVDLRRFPFAFPYFGGGVDRPGLYASVNASLSARGLVHGSRFAPELEDTLRLFGTGRLSVSMLGSAGERQLIALAVFAQDRVVVGVQTSGGIRFDVLAEDGAVRALVGLLPPLAPAHGASVTVTESAAPAPRRVDEDFASASYLHSTGGPSDQAGRDLEAAQRILAMPRLGSGAFVVAEDGRHGQLGPSESVSWLDTDAGRYLVISDRGADGRLHVTYTPGDQAKLDHQLHRLLARFS
ncbi:ESX secretion-associated protein EspG [Kutzneria viridogrisea]|uniref:ESX secretion-associated protein EspG n=2 Tax=Kutzneria TaxID=43356 RepID=W5W4S9_9PSEU|nr:ESX secretion-associated protein EspG [Kutzneria albida]AHH95481.1 hypothetical protein KALB_2112 [Kutzneria albida DSM 43870]MBA8927160.1 hypothetical protein [Kutzneria viridogrisea]